MAIGSSGILYVLSGLFGGYIINLAFVAKWLTLMWRTVNGIQGSTHRPKRQACIQRLRVIPCTMVIELDVVCRVGLRIYEPVMLVTLGLFQ